MQNIVRSTHKGKPEYCWQAKLTFIPGYLGLLLGELLCQCDGTLKRLGGAGPDEGGARGAKRAGQYGRGGRAPHGKGG